jgi:hypothetical protein
LSSAALQSTEAINKIQNMIEFTITTMPADAEKQKGFTVGFRLHPGADSVSEIEMLLLKSYLTPTAFGVLEKLLEVDGRQIPTSQNR